MINQAGEIDWAARLDPWGNIQQEYNPHGIEQNIRLPGQYHDRETDLYYNRFRYYDRKIGAYINQDPIGLAGGLNGYHYPFNPIRGIDPLGIQAFPTLSQENIAESFNFNSLSFDTYTFNPFKNFDVTAYTNKMRTQANKNNLGKCARYVRQGLEAGGANTKGYPANAKNYGQILENNGFRPIPSENYFPQPGDTAIFQPYAGGNSAGHIKVFDGNNWVSDFSQRSFTPGRGYANSQYQIYRVPQ